MQLDKSTPETKWKEILNTEEVRFVLFAELSEHAKRDHDTSTRRKSSNKKPSSKLFPHIMQIVLQLATVRSMGHSKANLP